MVQPSQQVPQAVHDGLGHLVALSMERVHAERWLGGVGEAQEWHAHLVAVGEAHGAGVIAA